MNHMIWGQYYGPCDMSIIIYNSLSLPDVETTVKGFENLKIPFEADFVLVTLAQKDY